MQELKPYGDLTKLNKCRDLLDTVGRDMLERIGHSYLDLLETSSAIYEVDGSYATALFTSSYCKFLDRTSRSMCATDDDGEALESGKWLCHESCWTEASRCSIETGKPYDLRPCKGGINIYAVPIKAGEKIIGSINFGYGNPPTDEKTIDELTERFKVNRDDLLQVVGEYRPRPDYIIEAAKRHLHLAAELIGEIYVRKKTEEALRQKLDEVERFNKLMIGRELKMEELRKEIERLKARIVELEK